MSCLMDTSSDPGGSLPPWDNKFGLNIVVLL